MSMKIIPTLLAAFAMMAALPASAIPVAGDKAPEIAASDFAGKPQTLKTLAGRKGIVVMFFRSAAWCPYCKAQLIAMNADAAQPLAKRGYTLVGLSYDPAPVLAKFAAERRIAWPLLSDPRSTVIDAWGLRDPAYPAGNMAHGVPRPAIFVIDTRGVIKARLMEEHYRQRPPAASVIAAIDALGI